MNNTRIEEIFQLFRYKACSFDFFHIIITIAALLALFADFFTKSYDGDIDHEIYFGQRLLSGELIWTVEYHDKLFVVQLLHAIPAYFESVQVLRIMSLASCLSAAWSLWALLPKLSGPGAIWPLKPSHVALIYISGMTLLPESIAHINSIAGNLALISILLFFNDRRSPARLLGAATIAALAISIRPYLLLPILTVAIWYGLRNEQPARMKAMPTLRLFLVWTIAVGAAGVFLNVGVYAVTGNMEGFWAGITMLAQKATSDTTFSILRTQARVVFSANWIMVSAVTAGTAWLALAIIMLRRGQETRIALIDLLFIGAAFPIIFQLSFISKHFWPSYANFVFPFALLGTYFLVSNTGAMLRSNIERAFFQGVMVGYFAFFTSTTFSSSLSEVREVTRTNRDHVNHWELVFLTEFLSHQPEGQRDFLVPTDMYSHWKLNEPRRGFPHATNIEHVTEFSFLTWLEVPRHFDFPKTYSSICEKIRKETPHLVAIWQSKPLFACLSARDSGFNIAAELPMPHKRDRFIIFARHVQSIPNTPH
jgi:hypothetical protein